MKIVKQASVIEDSLVKDFQHILCDHASQYKFDCLVTVLDGDNSDKCKYSYYLVEYRPIGEPPYLFSQVELPNKVKAAIEKYSGLEVKTFDRHIW